MKTIILLISLFVLFYGLWPPTWYEVLLIPFASWMIASFIAALIKIDLSGLFQNPNEGK